MLGGVGFAWFGSQENVRLCDLAAGYFSAV
jgi:hypothetical protein